MCACLGYALIHIEFVCACACCAAIRFDMIHCDLRVFEYACL